MGPRGSLALLPVSPPCMASAPVAGSTSTKDRGEGAPLSEGFREDAKVTTRLLSRLSREAKIGSGGRESQSAFRVAVSLAHAEPPQTRRGGSSRPSPRTMTTGPAPGPHPPPAASRPLGLKELLRVLRPEA